MIRRIQVNGPAWFVAQPWDSAISTGLAAACFVLWREHSVGRGAGVTEVLAPAPSERGSSPRPANMYPP